jgi:hypothetical protein
VGVLHTPTNPTIHHVFTLNPEEPYFFISLGIAMIGHPHILPLSRIFSKKLSLSLHRFCSPGD